MPVSAKITLGLERGEGGGGGGGGLVGHLKKNWARPVFYEIIKWNHLHLLTD